MRLVQELLYDSGLDIKVLYAFWFTLEPQQTLNPRRHRPDDHHSRGLCTLPWGRRG